MKKLTAKYNHALDRLYDLFKDGREKEKQLEAKNKIMREALEYIVKREYTGAFSVANEALIKANKLNA